MSLPQQGCAPQTLGQMTRPVACLLPFAGVFCYVIAFAASVAAIPPIKIQYNDSPHYA